MAEILINGVRAGWGDIEFNVLGRQVTGITEFKLNIKQSKSNKYGQGNLPVHRGRGNKMYEGAGIKMYKYEVDAIMALLAPGQDLTDVPPFTLIAIFTAVGDDTLTTLTVPMTEFTEMAFAPKQGDESLEFDLPLIIGQPQFKNS
jgi:hypothetical protein